MRLVSPRPPSPLHAVGAIGAEPMSADQLGAATTRPSNPDQVVIATKLYAPTFRDEPIERSRLEQQLRAGTRTLLTLVVAPAGWGKTSLLADWLHRNGVAAGWVSLDAGDDDVTRFWRYLLLAAAQAGVGPHALRRLDAPGADIERDVLPVFLNELAGAPDDLVLVLDDYHLVGSAAVHTSVATLLDLAPAQLHLVISSRTDPPLGLSRRRVAGKLYELRADHLRFTVDEAVQFLRRATGAAISEAEVRRLVVRTEGWAAGLQLAALRLADRSGDAERAEFIDRFTGADRHVVDYLGEEVLAQQPAEIREFLLATSLLDRICAEVADAVTERGNATACLDAVFRANLFLTPLDDEQHWFRYHQLFRDILRHELARLDPSAVPRLHRRAALWYAAAGDHSEAIKHGISAEDPALVVELVAQGWRQEFNAGHLQTVQAWLAALPAETTAADTRLTVARVWLALDRGQLDEADAVLSAAEERSSGDPHLEVLRTLHTYKIGDLSGAADRLAAIGPVGDPFLRTVRDLLAGLCALWLDDQARADAALRDASATALANANTLGHIYAIGARALLAVQRGDLTSATRLLTEVDTEVSDAVSDAHFVAMFPAIAHARLAAVTGAWEPAAQYAERGVELGRRGAGKVELAAALLTSVRASTALGPGTPEYGVREARLAEARLLLRNTPEPGPVVTAWLAGEQRNTAPARLAGVDKLTDREQAILNLLPGPLTQRELAGALFVTPNTLKTHLRAIYRKLGADSRLEAVDRARALGLLQP
jgi:LuxR family maltose regulon positive regulatory protein